MKIEFGSLVGFAMSGEGISTLQADQLNAITHHIHSICIGKDLWPKKQQWPKKLDTVEMIAQEIHIAKLQQQKLQQQMDWQDFLESEWKQLDQYMRA